MMMLPASLLVIAHAGYRSVAHYLIQKSLEEQAAAAKQAGSAEGLAAAKGGAVVLPAESEPSDASAQTAGGGVAACDGDEHEATADGGAVTGGKMLMPCDGFVCAHISFFKFTHGSSGIAFDDVAGRARCSTRMYHLKSPASETPC